MGVEPDIGALLGEIRAARQRLASRDQKIVERVDELEASLNQILVGMRRPGADYAAGDRDLERKSAIEMCEGQALLDAAEIRRALGRTASPSAPPGVQSGEPWPRTDARWPFLSPKARDLSHTTLAAWRSFSCVLRAPSPVT